MSLDWLDRVEARRIAVRAQLLEAHRPTDLLTVVNHLTFLQLDPTAAIAPSADLVAWTRLGAAYQPVHLQQALEQDRSLFEHRAQVRPMSDLGLYLAEMAAWPGHDARRREWLHANESFRRYVLDLLRDRGPLLSRDVPDRSAVPWPSTGWTNNRNVTPDVGLPHCPRRNRHRWPPRPAAPMGPGRTRLPGWHASRCDGRSPHNARREAAARPGHRPHVYGRRGR
jgi:uncharacterized protein YcaQ